MRADVLSLTQRIVFPALYTSKWSYCVICSILEQTCFISEQLYCSGRDPPSTLLQRCTCFHGALCGFSGSHQCRNIQPHKHVPFFNTGYVLCTFILWLYVTHSRVKIANYTNIMCVKCVPHTICVPYYALHTHRLLQRRAPARATHMLPT